MIKFLCLSLLSFMLAARADVYSDIMGVWDSPIGTDGCGMVVQILYKNFLGYSYGASCPRIGSYVGTYTLSESLFLISFAYTPVNNPQLFGKFSFTVSSDKTTFTLKDPSTGATSIVYTKKAGNDAFDGVWEGTVDGTSLSLVTEFRNGMYLSFNLPNTDGTGSSVFGGVFEYPASGTTGKIIYCEFKSGSVGSLQRGEQLEVSPVTMSLVGSGPAFQLVSTSSALPFSVTFSTKRAASAFDGVWVRSVDGSGGCFQTVQFTQGIFRSYILGPLGASCVNSQTGTFKEVSSTELLVSYALGTDGALDGTAATITYELIAGTPQQLHLSGTGFDFVLTKVDQPPNAIFTELHLEGDINTFVQSSFEQTLATVTGTPAGCFQTTATKSGSIIVDVAVVDDQTKNGKSSSTTYSTLSTQTTLGGYNVLSVTNTDPTPTPSPTVAGSTGSKVAASASISMISMIFMLIAIFALL